jgi:hypothetical protein
LKFRYDYAAAEVESESTNTIPGIYGITSAGGRGGGWIKDSVAIINGRHTIAAGVVAPRYLHCGITFTLIEDV